MGQGGSREPGEARERSAAGSPGAKKFRAKLMWFETNYLFSPELLRHIENGIL
jgi:hypothetical protein